MTSLDPIPAERWDTSISFIFGLRHTCTYCGDPADGLDHVVPWSFISAAPRTPCAGKQAGVRTWTCRECNSILGSRVFPTMWLRIMYVNQRLQVRLAEHMAHPLWSREEMKGLRPGLRRQVEARNYLARVARARIGWPYNPTCLEILQEVRQQASDETQPGYRMCVARFFGRTVASEDGVTP